MARRGVAFILQRTGNPRTIIELSISRIDHYEDRLCLVGAYHGERTRVASLLITLLEWVGVREGVVSVSFP